MDIIMLIQTVPVFITELLQITLMAQPELHQFLIPVPNSNMISTAKDNGIQPSSNADAVSSAKDDGRPSSTAW